MNAFTKPAGVRWINRREPTKMRVAGDGLTEPSRFWRAVLEGNQPDSMALFLRVLDGVEASNRRLMEKLDEVQTRCSSLEGKILVANNNFEQTRNIPERLQKVERFVWAASAFAAFMGVLIGGAGQRMITDSLMKQDTPRHEERFDDQTPPSPRPAATSP